MLLTAFLHSADAECGKVDYDALSEQTLLELLIQDVKNISALQDSDGGFLDISEWPGLSFDVDGKVGHIDYYHYLGESLFGDPSDDDSDDENDDCPIGPGGSIDLRWVPMHVTEFSMQGLKLSGTIETASLPRKLIDFDITGNEFSGPFETTDLPSTSEDIRIRENQLSGTLDMTALPPKLQIFDAGNNRFTGSVDFGSLPEGVTLVDVGGNKFTGSVDLSKIPADLASLCISPCGFARAKLVIRVPKAGLDDFRIDRFREVVDIDGNDLRDKFLLYSY